MKPEDVRNIAKAGMFILPPVLETKLMRMARAAQSAAPVVLPRPQRNRH